MILNHLFKIKNSIYQSKNTVIYRAVKIDDHRPVVLKQLKRTDPTAEELGRFRREFNIANRFNHDGIIRVFDLIRYENTMVIVMEDFGAESLQRLWRTDMEIHEKLSIALRCAEYLDQIHSKNIIHLDINPSNIVWCPQLDLLKFIDFGISTELREKYELKNPTLMEGTLPYISPEQTGRMNRSVDYRADLYSFGVTLYELFTGKLPFNESDPLKLIHAHIALSPKSPSAIDPTIPSAISEIILKLLLKEPQYRYQSAQGLKYDLAICLKQIKMGVNNISFEIGKNDTSSVFQIPQKLYGRNADRKHLISIFERVCVSGKSALAWVSGPSGIGKSAIVGELHKAIVQRQAFFVSGKFGHMEQSLPHHVLIQAFSALFEQILAEPEEILTEWRKKIINTVNPNGKIITDIIPIAKHLIGEQPELIQLPAKERQNRFNTVFYNLCWMFAKKEHPLLFFFDDLQWADATTLALIENLILNAPKFMCLIGSFRDNEISKTHQLSGIKEKLDNSNIPLDITEIKLKPLNHEYTNRLIADTLKRSKEKTNRLAGLCHLQTKGNPFHLSQYLTTLYQDGVVEFQSKKGKWIWNADKLSSLNIVNDVGLLMQSRFKSLPAASQQVFMIAACIDNRISLKKLACACSQNLLETSSHMLEIIKDGYVIPSENYKYIGKENSDIKVEFRFVHDSIRQAAYELIPLSEKEKYHCDIGRRFLKEYNGKSEFIDIFDVVKHLNLSKKLISEEKERYELSRLNWKTGQKAIKDAAWQQAYEYFLNGIELLNQDCWVKNYSHSLELHISAAEATYLISYFEKVEFYVEIVLKRSNSLLEKCRAWEIQINSLIAQGKRLEAVTLGLSVLEKIGIKIRSNTPKILLFISLVKAKFELNRIESNPYKIIMTDPYKLTASRILMIISTSAYVCGNTVFISIILNSVKLYLKHGLYSHVGYTLAAFSGILTVIGHYDDAFKVGNVALKYAKKDDAKAIRSKTMYLVSAFAAPWKVYYRELLSDLQTHYVIGMETGDHEYAAFNIYLYCVITYMSGEELSKLDKLMTKYGWRIKSQDTISRWYDLYHQLVKNLCDKSSDPCILSGSICNENEFKSHFEKSDIKFGLYILYTIKTMVYYLFGDLVKAMDACDSTCIYISAAMSSTSLPMSIFYQSLTICAYIKKGIVGADRRKKLHRLKQYMRKMKRWAHHNPINFGNKYHLICAEFENIRGHYPKAEKLYHQAIRLAKRSKNIQEMAISFELVANFYQNRGYDTLFEFNMIKAFKSYKKWGALAKCRFMIKQYPSIFRLHDRFGNELFDTNLPTLIHTTETTESSNIDLLSVLKASQVISGEMDINRLSESLLRIAMENAGAQNGVLLINKNNDFIIQSILKLDGTKIKLLSIQPIDNLDYPTTVINFVARTKEIVRLGNAGRSDYRKDDYIRKKRVKSVLCIPLVRNDLIVAILYLENNDVADAFTNEHIKIIELLSIQAIISLENVKFHESAKQKTKDRFLANVSHEIRTPIHSILGYSELLTKQINNESVRGDYLQNITNSGKLLLELIDDVLEFTKSESGNLKININAISLPSTIYEIERIFTAKMAAKNLKFDIHLDSEFNKKLIKIDERRLKQILINLIENACKYTNKGYVAVYIQEKMKHKSNIIDLVVEIEDSGIGILDTQKIFKEFEQISDQRSTGFGLGLAIVKNTLKELNGTISVKSELNKGSTFKVMFEDIECISTKSCDPLYEEKPETKIEFNSPTVLIVDDDKLNRDLLCDALKPYNINLKTAANGQESIDAVKNDSIIDLIVMDLKMPVMDGFEAIRIIKSTEKSASIPIIALTANMTQEAEDRCKSVGCDSILLKPAIPAVVVNELKRFLSYSESIDVEGSFDINNYKDLNKTFFNCARDNIQSKLLLKALLELEEKWGIAVNTIFMASTGFSVLANGEEIRMFAVNVKEVGSKFSHTRFADWGSDLYHHVDKLNLNEANQMLKQFPRILNELKDNLEK